MSAYYYWLFWKATSNVSLTSGRNFGLFDRPKQSFFLIMLISSILDMPMNVACIALNSPRSCEWNGVSYPIVWCLHLLSLNGYAYTIITPSILWSDVVNQKDGKLFFSVFPVDITKRFFQFLLMLYFLVTSLEFFQIIIYFDIKNHGNYGSSGWFTALPHCLEPALIFLIAIGCLWCGIRLQLYVMDVKFTGDVQVRITCIYEIRLTASHSLFRCLQC